MAILESRLVQACGGQRQIVFITGEPGIGKSTLVDALLHQAGGRVLVARGQCLEQYGASEAYLPWLDACARLCRDRPSFTGLLRTHAPMWLARMPSLLAETEREALQREIAGATQAQMLREMAEAIEALTTEVPLVLALEDLHWSDHSTLNLIAYLARRTQPAHLIVIGTFRPVDVIASGHPLQAVKHELEMHQQCAEVALAFLSEAAVAEYLVRRFPDRQLPAELPRAIHARTEGNALFMVNVVDELARAVINRAAESLVPDAALAALDRAAPAGIRHMVEQQVERLSEADQRVLEGASVAGAEFSSVAVAAALEADVVAIEECCERLARRLQFLRCSRQRDVPDGTVTARFRSFTPSIETPSTSGSQAGRAPSCTSASARAARPATATAPARLRVNWRCISSRAAIGSGR